MGDAEERIFVEKVLRFARTEFPGQQRLPGEVSCTRLDLDVPRHGDGFLAGADCRPRAHRERDVFQGTDHPHAAPGAAASNRCATSRPARVARATYMGIVA